MRTIFFFINMIFCVNSFSQVQPDSLIGIYTGTLYGKIGMEINWSIIDLYDTVYIADIDTSLCKVKSDHYCTNFCWQNLYSDYSYCNNNFNTGDIGQSFHFFYSDDSLALYYSWPSPPPNVDATYRKFLGKRIPNSSWVGINKEFKKNKCNLFPNPADKEIILELSSEVKQNYLVKLYNYFGQELMAVDMQKKYNKIDVSGLPEGIYIVKVTGNNFIKTEKIMVRH